MKTVFCLLPERGHINPFIGLAQAMLQNGHEVTTVATADISAQLLASGITFSRDLVPTVEPPVPKGKAFAELMDNPELHQAMIEKVFLDPISDQVPTIEDFLRRQRPDVVVIDPMNYAAVIAAQRLKIPWVGVSSSLTSVLPDELKTEIRATVDVLAPKRESIFRLFGEVPQFRAVDALSPFFNISFSTPDFVGAAPPEVEALGPSRPLLLRGDERPVRPIPKGRGVIYASFGSQVYYQPKIFQKIRQAAEALNVHLIMSVGDLISEPGWQDSANCQIYDYAPQIEILKKARVFITHGGANSVAESLTAAVPMLVHPICNDQVHQAYFIEKSSTGKSLNLRLAEVAEIRDTIEFLLTDEEIRLRTNQVSKSYQSNGALKAADRIESLLSRRHARNADHALKLT
jgi:UDP:flavonoid glycosyltransferase YjiC (YdhE family)